jgi:hypothetical protein
MCVSYNSEFRPNQTIYVIIVINFNRFRIGVTCPIFGKFQYLMLQYT